MHDPKTFVQEVVLKNCARYEADPSSFVDLWNAVVSLNTIAEYVALDQLGYRPDIKRKELEERAGQIRRQYPALEPINLSAIKLKHVRRHKGQQVTESSTDILLTDQETWVVDDGSAKRYIKDVIKEAIATLPTIPEITSRST